MQAGLSVNEPSPPVAMPQQQELSLRRNVSWTTVGNILYALCQWGVLTIIAKTGTPAMVGMFALGLAITAPVIQLANLQLRGIQATDARNEYAFSDYFTLRLITTALAVAVGAGIAVVGDRTRETTAVIALIVLAKAVDAISDVFYGHFQQRERMDVIARAQVANGILSVAFVAAGLLLTDSIVVGVGGYLLGSVVPLVGYTLPAAMRSPTPQASRAPTTPRTRLDASMRPNTRVNPARSPAANCFARRGLTACPTAVITMPPATIR
jgi:O-antigen/teichoic acid export membrane protein